jgi:hypothetical protein
MKAPKTLQFLVGCAVIYFAWHLADAGWFGRIVGVFSSPKGFSGGLSDLILDLLPYLVDTVCLFGAVALALYGLIARAVRPLGRKLLRLLDNKLESLGFDLIEFEDEKPNHKCGRQFHCENCPNKEVKDVE